MYVYLSCKYWPKNQLNFKLLNLKTHTSMKTLKIHSFVKIVSIIFSGYMLVLIALIIFLHK